MKLTRRLCDRCGLQLTGKRGHGFRTEDGRLLHGSCPTKPDPVPADEAAAMRKVSKAWWGE